MEEPARGGKEGGRGARTVRISIVALLQIQFPDKQNWCRFLYLIVVRPALLFHYFLFQRSWVDEITELFMSMDLFFIFYFLKNRCCLH